MTVALALLLVSVEAATPTEVVPLSSTWTYLDTGVDPGSTWTDPVTVPELAWRTTADGITEGNCDYTLGWHAPTGRVLVIGHTTRYRGNRLAYRTHGRDVAYTAYDPSTDSWLPWRVMPMPDRDRFFICGVHGQWLAETDGTLLVPIYFTDRDGAGTFLLKATVARCRFDGETLGCLETGGEMTLPDGGGLVEPSIAQAGDTFYLTLRNKDTGYVTTSPDGLDFVEQS